MNYSFQHLVSALLRQGIRRLAILLLTLPVMAAAASFNTAAVKGLSTAYGFVLGQEYSLSRIEKEYPDLAGGVVLARSQFDATFPDIQAKLEAQLKHVFGEKKFQALAVTMGDKVREALGRLQMTRPMAVDLFDQVKGRSKGIIESPVLEYLLAVKYQSNPAGEFADGFRQRYKTDGIGKSQGIKVNLQLPKSWAAKDGERPHIVQKWSSVNGTGMEMIFLDIRDAEGSNPSRQEMLRFVTSGEVRDIVPDGGAYVASGNFSLEKQTGYWVQMSLLLERAGMKMYQDSVINQLFFRGKAIAIGCAVVGPENERQKIGEAFKRMKPLCQQVLNSLVLPQAY